MTAAADGPLRLALVGLRGPHSRGWLETLQQLPEGGQVLACDVDAAGDAGVAPPTATHPALELPAGVQTVGLEGLAHADHRPDVAIVSVRNDQAAAVGGRLLAAGVPCIVEKPAGRTSADLEALSRAAATGGTIWAPAFLNRLQPAARRIHRLVREGALGHLVSVEARMVTSSVRQRNPEHWLFRRDLAGGGILHWLAIHTVDLIRYLTGDEFAHVSGDTATFTRGIDVEDMAALSFRLRGGALGTLHAGYVLRQRYGDIGLTLRGDLGEVVWPQWDFQGRHDTLYLHSEGPRSDGPGSEVTTLAPPEAPGYGGALGQEFVRRFAHAARMGGPFVVSGDDALKALQFVEAAYAASAGGGRVRPGA